ncbi:MAG: response regulator [Flavobacterium sp. JAD_PAG50586_2]|nr:MAG: response regulator [Flavobacterium sp. JAD_PAG50586_2]
MELYKPLTIIIADDDEDDRELLRFLFNKNDKFELVGCYDSGVEAVKEIMVNKNIPDILIIDMYMPLLTGAEVITKIEESGIAPHMTKFIISTTINNAEENKYLNNPSVKFIKKPVTLAEINDLPGDILEILNYNNDMRV